MTPVSFAELGQWTFSPSTGNLVHSGGHFFAVEGLRLSFCDNETHLQPIINQPEIGILGILAKEFNGILHLLMQAKAEPGNRNTLQLSPTVQATRSNHTRQHHGQATRYLEYFTGQRPSRTLLDVLQSEQGTWFWNKRNRNIVVETFEDVAEHADFRWLPLRQVLWLLHMDNLVNMDTRTILGSICVGHLSPTFANTEPFRQALARSYDATALRGDTTYAQSSEEEILSWLIDAKMRWAWTRRLVGLDEIATWSRTTAELTDNAGQDFRIIAARIQANSREIAHWTQPLLAPRCVGAATFLLCTIDGVVHLLVQARPEPGLRDVVELAPSIQVPAGVDAAAPEGPPRHLEEACTAPTATVRFETVLSEEGGRFYHAQTRYRLVELPHDFPLDIPTTHRWLTVRQLMDLVRHGHYVNIEARSLLACLHSLL